MAFAVKTTVSHHVSTATNVTPSLFAPSKASYAHTCLSIPFKPLSFNLSCSYSSSLSLPNFLSLKRKEPISPVSVISAQQEENFPLAVEEQGQESEGSLNWGASQSDAELNEEAKVYVGNLPYDVDHVQLAAIFEDAGIVEEARVIMHRESDESRGFGFVTMNTVEEAEKAVEMFNQYDIGGRLLTVNKASPKGSRPERPPRVFEASSTRLYVGNLPWTKTDDGLKQIFTPFGKVVSARVVTDRETGRSRGFGFVEMSSDSEAQDAIANLDGELVEGRGIRVNIASADRRRSSY